MECSSKNRHRKAEGWPCRYNGAQARISEKVTMTRQPLPSGSLLTAIREFNADRIPELVRLKLKRLRKSVFGFFRGTDELYGRAWPTLQPRDPGPVIQSTGDLHLENFGVCHSESGSFHFEINDFDDAVLAPCSFDLIRCTASILLAGEEWKLTPLTATGIALAFLENYCQAVSAGVETNSIGEITAENATGPIAELLAHTCRGTDADLLNRMTRRKKSGARQILRSPNRHPSLDAATASAVRDAVQKYGAQRGQEEYYRVLDVTGRIAGIGSLGVRRYTVLVAGEGEPAALRLLDLKQARPSAVAQYIGVKQPRFATEAERVVQAQRRLQGMANSGLGVLSLDGTSFRIREMIPDEHRSRLEAFHKKPRKLRQAVEQVGKLVGWAQLRAARAAGEGHATQQALGHWVTGPAIDAVLAAAVRFADLTRTEYATYCDEFAGKKRLRH
jgi:uncharacterized protein (DUF2252 family)